MIHVHERRYNLTNFILPSSQPYLTHYFLNSKPIQVVMHLLKTLNYKNIFINKPLNHPSSKWCPWCTPLHPWFGPPFWVTVRDGCTPCHVTNKIMATNLFTILGPFLCTLKIGLVPGYHRSTFSNFKYFKKCFYVFLYLFHY